MTKKSILKLNEETDLNLVQIKSNMADEHCYNHDPNAPFTIIKAFINESYNLVRNEITYDFESNGKTLTEQDINSLFIDMKQRHSPAKGLTKESFDIYLNSNNVRWHNPIKHYFENNEVAPFEGSIKGLAESLILPIAFQDNESKKMGNRELVQLFLTKWLVGMVASLYDRNYNCLMIVLIGKKGCGKTEFFRRLLPPELQDYFAQSKFKGGKDDEALMCEKLMILNDELDGLHSKEAKEFRNFISSNTYTYRPPYGRKNITRKRLASISGASNDSNIINDAANNRRIVPIEIKNVNHDKYNSIDKKALLFEAFHLFKSGYNWELSQEEMKYLDEFCKSYEIPSVEYELVTKYFSNEGPSEMTCSEIKEHIEKAGGQRLSLTKLGKALKQLGFKSEHKKVKGHTKQLYTCTLLVGNN